MGSETVRVMGRDTTIQQINDSWLICPRDVRGWRDSNGRENGGGHGDDYIVRGNGQGCSVEHNVLYWLSDEHGIDVVTLKGQRWLKVPCDLIARHYSPATAAVKLERCFELLSVLWTIADDRDGPRPAKFSLMLAAARELLIWSGELCPKPDAVYALAQVIA